jgi:hypothetical protein
MGSPVIDAITALTAPRMWRVELMSERSAISSWNARVAKARRSPLSR